MLPTPGSFDLTHLRIMDVMPPHNEHWIKIQASRTKCSLRIGHRLTMLERTMQCVCCDRVASIHFLFVNAPLGVIMRTCATPTCPVDTLNDSVEFNLPDGRRGLFNRRPSPASEDVDADVVQTAVLALHTSDSDLNDFMLTQFFEELGQFIALKASLKRLRRHATRCKCLPNIMTTIQVLHKNYIHESAIHLRILRMARLW